MSVLQLRSRAAQEAAARADLKLRGKRRRRDTVGMQVTRFAQATRRHGAARALLCVAPHQTQRSDRWEWSEPSRLQRRRLGLAVGHLACAVTPERALQPEVRPAIADQSRGSKHMVFRRSFPSAAQIRATRAGIEA